MRYLGTSILIPFEVDGVREYMSVKPDAAIDRRKVKRIVRFISRTRFKKRVSTNFIAYSCVVNKLKFVKRKGKWRQLDV